MKKMRRWRMRIKKPVCRDQGHLDRRGCLARKHRRCASGGGHAEASARRLLLRVTTPLASTAIIHCSPPFNLWFDDVQPGANQNGPVFVRKGSFATRHREPTEILSLPEKLTASVEPLYRKPRHPPRRSGSCMNRSTRGIVDSVEQPACRFRMHDEHDIAGREGIHAAAGVTRL